MSPHRCATWASRRGERVGLLISNRPEWLEAFFGTVIAGGVVVAFSTWSTPDELDWLMQDSAVRVLIALDRFGANDFATALGRLVPSSRYPSLHDVVILAENQAAEFIPYDTLRSGPPMQREAPGVAPCAADDAIIIYTSGSSSRPKSVPLSHGGIIENGFNIGERQGYQPSDRVLLAPPLFWSYGSANAMSATLTHGAALVLQDRFEPGEAIDLIERHRCTALYTLPAITSGIISHASFRPERVRSLRTGLTIGAPQDVVTAATVLGAAEICNVYGQTESYGNCCVTPHDWPLERRAACQGPPLPGVQVRIVDGETGAELPRGDEGMIEVRGYIMRGYIGSSASQTADAMTADGFFRTGDMGRLLRGRHDLVQRPRHRDDQEERHQHLSGRGGGCADAPCDGRARGRGRRAGRDAGRIAGCLRGAEAGSDTPAGGACGALPRAGVALQGARLHRSARRLAGDGDWQTDAAGTEADRGIPVPGQRIVTREAWRRWGEDDERGALNHIAAAQIRGAAALVRSGEVLSLAQPLSPRTPVPRHRAGVQHFMGRDGGDYAAGARRPGGFQFAEDTVMLPLHIGTHIDALCHAWYDDALYNGFPGSGTRSTSGATRCGIDKMGPIVGRGVLLDIAGARGGPLPDGAAIGRERSRARRRPGRRRDRQGRCRAHPYRLGGERGSSRCRFVR